jgi:hypothetical protein
VSRTITALRDSAWEKFGVPGEAVKRFAVALVALMLFFGTWWLSEDLYFPIALLQALRLDHPSGILLAGFAVVAALACVGSSIVWRNGWPARLAAAALLIAGTFSGGYVGGRCGSSALNECAQTAEEVRTRLAKYRQKTGTFPGTLEDLGTFLVNVVFGERSCITRPTVIHMISLSEIGSLAGTVLIESKSRQSSDNRLTFSCSRRAPARWPGPEGPPPLQASACQVRWRVEAARGCAEGSADL